MKIKIPKFPKNSELLRFLNSIGINKKVLKSKSKKVLAPNKKNVFLYKLITLNKRLTALEFGSGWSSLIMSLSFYENSQKFKKKYNLPKRKISLKFFL